MTGSQKAGVRRSFLKTHLSPSDSPVARKQLDTVTSLSGFGPHHLFTEAHSLCRNNKMEGLEDELTCPVCLELYTCPLLLPCHHNLCRRCAEAFLEAPAGEPEGAQAASVEKGAGYLEPFSSSTDGKPRTFACPTCRKDVRLGDRGVDGLGTSLLLQNIIDRFKQIHAPSHLKEAVACLVCDATPPRDAVKSCTTCKLSYCSDCLQLLHPSRGGLAKHTLVPPVESFDDLKPAVVCPDHKDKPVELYCMRDGIPICSLCKLVSKHEGHRVTALQEAFEDRRADLQKVVDEVSEKVEQETKKIEELEAMKAAMENHATQLKSQIATECEELVRIIRERKIAMLKRVDTVAQTDTARIQTAIDSCEEAVKTAKSSLAFAKEAIKERDPVCFLQSVQAIKGRVEESSSGLVQDEEYKRIPTDRLRLEMDPAVKKSLGDLDFPSPPVICPNLCTTTMQEAKLSWEAGHKKVVTFDVLCSRGNESKPLVKIPSLFGTGYNPSTWSWDLTTSTTLRDLQASTSYVVAVVAKNAGGTARSDNFLIKTAATDPNQRTRRHSERGRGRSWKPVQ
ncbi:hypothetical protein Bbelb_238490 [Branchiostoma belcheri]|nr:hypothetical protein Bbelb_238490 [Branchiostoma belcheri]